MTDEQIEAFTGIDLKSLSPNEERRQHQLAILSTIPEPSYEHVLSTKMVLSATGANTFEGHSESRVKMYAENWSPCIAGMVALIKRKNNPNYITVDGRHRWIVTRVKKMPFHFHALVYYDLNEQQEAALFWIFNEARRNPSAAEKHLSAALSGDPLAMTVDEVLVRHGISRNKLPMATCEAVVKGGESLVDGAQTLDFVLRALTDCFPTDARRFDSVLLRGFAVFYRWHGADPHLDYTTFVDRVRSAGLIAPQLKSKAVEQARTSGVGAGTKVARILMQAWNRAPGYKLSEP
jgi:hypothetical protein